MKYHFEYVDEDESNVFVYNYPDGTWAHIPKDAEFEILRYEDGDAIIKYNDNEYMVYAHRVGFHEITYLEFLEYLQICDRESFKLIATDAILSSLHRTPMGILKKIVNNGKNIELNDLIDGIAKHSLFLSFGGSALGD